MGRSVRCARCKEIWTVAAPADIETPVPAELGEPPATPDQPGDANVQAFRDALNVDSNEPAANAVIGVIGVIGPWNYPMFTPMGSIAYALAAGNTVVFKPSEFTPGVGKLLEESFAQVCDIPNLFKCITGLGETGRFLCEAPINKLAFTGSTRTAKLVAETCAKNMIPVLLECGGKDPVLVDKDANIKLAAEYTIWSAMANAGQSCIGAERVYVHAKVADKFQSAVLDIVKNLEPGASYGPATMPKQLEIIKRHISDATAAGAKMLFGDVHSVNERIVNPVVMAEVPENCSAMTEETFGPTLVINSVRNMDEAVDLANATTYGLGAAVWSKKNGKKILIELNGFLKIEKN